jgi:hypothetical protein
MSCTSGCGNNDVANYVPCSPCGQTQNDESVASWLNNLTTAIFGAITKTVTNGQAVWSIPCAPYDEIAGYTKLAGEGQLCYLTRLLPVLGITYLGNWSAVTNYVLGNIVTVGSQYLYRAKAANLNAPPASNPALWDLILTAPTGPPGTGVAASAPTAIVNTTPVTLTNSGGVVFCEPGANTVINLPQISAVDAGKWFEIRTNSSTYTVTITPFAGNTIGGGSSYVLNLSGEVVLLRSVSGSADWRVC